MCGERDGSHDGNDEAGRLLRRRIVSERHNGLLEDGAVQHRVGIGARICGDTEARARDELADHRLSQCRFSTVGIGACGEYRHRKRFHAGRQMRGRAQRVIAAATCEQQDERGQGGFE